MLKAGLSKGTALSERQSLLVDADAIGRLEAGVLRGATLDAAGRYYFRQSPRRLLYLELSTQAGKNLDADQQILLGGDSGLRGYPLRYQAGEGRWLFTAEQRFYTNWFPFQLFNVGAAVFYDMGSTWGRDPLGTPSQGLLRDIGFGLRLGNSRSALGNVLHIDVAFPLDGDPTIKNVQFIVETKEKF
jgi:hemolysin activation/secretion protein